MCYYLLNISDKKHRAVKLIQIKKKFNSSLIISPSFSPRDNHYTERGCYHSHPLLYPLLQMRDFLKNIYYCLHIVIHTHTHTHTHPYMYMAQALDPGRNPECMCVCVCASISWSSHSREFCEQFKGKFLSRSQHSIWHITHNTGVCFFPIVTPYL